MNNLEAIGIIIIISVVVGVASSIIVGIINIFKK